MKTDIDAKTAWLVITIAVLISLLALWVSYKSFNEELSRMGQENFGGGSNKYTSIVEVNFGDGKKRWFEGTLGKETYPLTVALESISQTGSLNIEIKKGKIYSVADVGDGAGAWIVYYNSALEKKSLEKLVIKKGDFYSLRFEKTK